MRAYIVYTGGRIEEVENKRVSIYRSSCHIIIYNNTCDWPSSIVIISVHRIRIGWRSLGGRADGRHRCTCESIHLQ